MRWGTARALAFIVLAGAQPAYAQTVTRYDFDIANGSRIEVIRAIARATGAKVSFATLDDTALNDPVGPIRGKLTLVQALEQALIGSAWFVEDAGNNQVRIARSDGNSSDIVVTGQRLTERKEDSNLLTRTDTPLKDTPGTIVSVTQSVLQSQNVTSIDEAIRNLPGVSFIGGSPSQLSARGGTTEGASFTNGLRNSSLGGNAPTIDVDSIEVLKGPSSIISGTAVAGGLLNIVPKTAVGTSRPQISLGGGTYGYIRGDADVGGAISEDARLYWRLVGLVEYANRQNGGGNNPHSYSTALILGYRDNGWKIDAQTQIYDTRTVYGALYANDDTAKAVVPVSFIDNSDAYYQVESKSQNLRLEKDLVTSEKLSLRFRTNGRYQEADQKLQNINNGGVLTLPPFGTQNFVQLLSQQSSSRQLSLSADIYAKVITGRLQQQLIAAFDYSGEHLDVLTSGAAALFPLSPVPPLVTIPTGPGAGIAVQQLSRNNYGVVVQDQITLGRFHVLAGLRKSWFTTRSSPIPSFRQSVNKLLPSGGVVFKTTDWASLYYSYQKGLTPPQPLLRLFSGDPLEPVITTGHEAGVKLELFNARLSVTGNYFRRSTSYITLPDPVNVGFSLIGPVQEAEGFEIAQIGKVTPTLFVQSGVTYAKSATGTPLIGAPRYTANFWVLKNFDIGTTSRIDIGLGGNLQYDTNISELNILAGTSTYPRLHRDYARFDAAIGYTSGPYKLNLTVNNLFDRFNLLTPLIATNLFRGTGRDVKLVFTTTLPGVR